MTQIENMKHDDAPGLVWLDAFRVGWISFVDDQFNDIRHHRMQLRKEVQVLTYWEGPDDTD